MLVTAVNAMSDFFVIDVRIIEYILLINAVTTFTIQLKSCTNTHTHIHTSLRALVTSDQPHRFWPIAVTKTITQRPMTVFGASQREGGRSQ